MGELLYPYLAGTVSLGIILAAAGFAYFSWQRHARDYQEKAARIPDFVRWTQLMDDIERLEERRAALRDEVEGAEAIVEHAARERQWLEEHDESIRAAKQARLDREEAESELVTTREQLALEKEELRKQNEQLAKITFDHARIKERLDADIELQECLEKERDGLEIHIGNLRDEDKRLTDDVRTTKEALAGLKAEVAGLEARKATLREEVDQLEDRRGKAESRLDGLKSTLVEMEGRVGKLTGAEQALKERLKTSGAHPGGGGLEELRERVVDPGYFAVGSSELEERDALSRLERSIEESDLHFDRRVLWAFHTALKTSMETPLLVLAGISGTGKSLLPQLYADCMGMHSLLVPVQPRWDGPQDLLGFFNYLEGRYKPTELARALLQFDRFNPVFHGSDDALDGRVLLVILDEMNLARVEYYFSEFLSRLESRRNVQDAKDEQQRERAEIHLEVPGLRDDDGGAGNASPVRSTRIYVDRNVLFVGTINEDESTQTLSDKVVDRANVMRFGRPRDLRRGESGELRRPDREQHWLTRKNWLEWTGADAAHSPSLDRGRQEKLLGWIEGLNESLQSIGRPFAYRTRNAIARYVASYPDQGEEGFRFATADQVEQRILPKLRGVEWTDPAGRECLHGVLAVLESLKDEQLTEAFRLALKRAQEGQQGHLFVWHGVDRLG